MKPRTQEELDEQERINRYAEAHIKQDRVRGYRIDPFAKEQARDGRIIGSERFKRDNDRDDKPRK